jgi:hypothetical protein
MERILEKLAQQLNAYDEASLMSLWDKYAERVQHFEPTKRWEEAVLIFGFIQALRWKNQLFNYHWSESARPGEGPGPVAPDASSPFELPPDAPRTGEPRPETSRAGEPRPEESGSGNGPAVGGGAKKRAKVLRFRPPKDDESV